MKPFFVIKRHSQIALLGLVALTLIVPLTIIQTQQQQEIRQRAAEPTPIRSSVDLNKDTKIDQKDYEVFKTCLGKTPIDMCIEEDLNRDGIIDQKDQEVLIEQIIIHNR